MTYPPPPPGPPGAGGWPAGDPHESPTMYDPYASGQPGGAAPGSPVYPAGGYPQAPDSSPPGSTPSGGYGPPPGYPPADPYQPGYQPPNPYQPGQPGPYQPDPNQPNPYQAGYQPGYPPDPYQAGQYGYQPGMPGMPPQPPRRSRTGLIVGGVAGGVVLLLMLTVGGVFALRAVNSDEPDRPITAPPGSNQPIDPNPGTTDAPAPPPPPPAGGGTYTFVPALCEVLDLSPVFDVVPTPDDPADWTAFESDTSVGSHSSCVIDLDDGQALGGLSIQAITSDGSARDDYEIMVDSPLSEPDSVEDVNSPWEEGQLWLGDDLAEEAARVIALDNNLALSVSAWLFSAPGSQEDLEAAVLQIAEEILTVTAQ